MYRPCRCQGTCRASSQGRPTGCSIQHSSVAAHRKDQQQCCKLSEPTPLTKRSPTMECLCDRKGNVNMACQSLHWRDQGRHACGRDLQLSPIRTLPNHRQGSLLPWVRCDFLRHREVRQNSKSYRVRSQDAKSIYIYIYIGSKRLHKTSN